MATQVQQDGLYEFMGFNDFSRKTAEDFDKLAKTVSTDYKPPISHPEISKVAGTNAGPPISNIPGTPIVPDNSPHKTIGNVPNADAPGTDKPFDYSKLGQLFLNNPAIPYPPGGTNVGQAVQARPINSPQFQVPPAIMFALSNLLRR